MSFALQCKLCNCKFGTSSFKGKRKANSDGNSLPRILPCGHVFCDKCITNKLVSFSQELGNDSHIVTCPFTACQEKSPLSDGEVKSLQVHKYLLGSIALESSLQSKNANRLLDLLEKSPSDLLKRQVSLDKCFNCQQMTADVMCKKCDNTYLCQPCFKSVHNSRVLASHKAVAIGGKGDGDFSLLEDLVHGNCSEHPSKGKEYYCMQCSMAMCGDCAILGGHSSHPVDRLDVVNQKLVPKLKETRKLASKIIDLSQQSQKKIVAEKAGAGDGPSSNVSLEKVEDVFLRLHAMLQLKQHAVEEMVHNATGNSSHLLEDFQAQAVKTGQQMECLIKEIDGVLSNPVYERSCDFQEFISMAEELLKQPCHLVVNNNSSASSLDIQINDEMLGRLSEVVTVSVNSDSTDKYEMKSIECVTEDELKSCPTSQRSGVASPFVSQSSAPDMQPVSSIQAASPAAPSHPQYSRQQSRSSLSSDHSLEFQPFIHDHRQLSRSQHHMLPGVEDDFRGRPTSGYADSQYNHSSHPDPRISNPEVYTSNYPGYRYKSFEYPPNDSVEPYNSHPHSQAFYNPPLSNQGPAYRQDESVGIDFQNYEKSAHQYTQQQKTTEAISYGSRDFRLDDPYFNIPPPRPPLLSPHQTMRPNSKNMAVGRGRGAPPPVFRQQLPLGSAQQLTAVANKKPLFMHPPPAITDQHTTVQVSHVESPLRFYVQVPQWVSKLKKIQPRIKEHCLSTPPLTDLHDVKYIFVKICGMWRRAEVLKVFDRSVQVFCSDYGDTTLVKACDIRPALGVLLSLPRQAIKCYLQGIQPADGSCSFTTDCSEQMKEALNHASAFTLVKLDTPITEADAQPVDLLLRDQNTSCLLSMRDFLVFTEHAVWDSPCCPYIPGEKELNHAYLKPQPMKEGDTVKLHITHVKSPHEIYAQIVDRHYEESSPTKTVEAELIKLDSIMKFMQEKYSGPTSLRLYKVFIPKPGDAVAASYEGVWYRAQIIALLPGHVKVRYIDYGNIEIVPADQIQVLFKEFKELPAQAVRLSIHGVAPLSEEQWSKKLCEGLAEMCTEKNCTAKVVSDCSSSEGLQVILTMTDTRENIALVLVKNGLAKRSAEEVQENEGMDCRCTHVESPGEFYLLPLQASDELTQLTAKLNALMESEETCEPSDYKWQVTDSCVLKHGKNWVRCIIEEIITDTRCKVRLIDSGQLISKPMADLRDTPESIRGPAKAYRASIAGIVPAGSSGVWGPTAKDTIKELLEDCENCKVVPLSQTKGSLPCDLLIPEEQPRKYQGVPGELIYISVKDRLLEAGVALRAAASLTASDTKKVDLEKTLVCQPAATSDTSPTKLNSKEITESDCSKNVIHTKDIPEDCCQERHGSGQQGEPDDWSDDAPPLDDAIPMPKIADSLVPKISSCQAEGSIKSRISSAKINSKKIFRAPGDGETRILKSPGGTIRSHTTDQTDPTSKLLHEAANRLAAVQTTSVMPGVSAETSFKKSPGDENGSAGSTSSSDVPTPELRLKLDKLLVGH